MTNKYDNLLTNTKNIMKKLLLAALCMAATMQTYAQTVAEDWAGLKHYQTANQTIKQPVKVVFMGNSITAGWPKFRPDFFTENHYVGRGIPCQVSAQMVMRFRQDVLLLKPQAVVILAGTNDIALNDYAVTLEHTLGNIQTMVDLAHAHGIKAVVCATPPAHRLGTKELHPAEKIKELNAMVKKYTHEAGIPYVDFHTALTDEEGGMQKQYTYDGVHPTKEGYLVMENLVQQALHQVLQLTEKE